MGWLTERFDQWCLKRQHDEMSRFVRNLRAMDGKELGTVVAFATGIRHGLESNGHMVMDPIVYFQMDPHFPATLNKAIRLNQKDGRLQDASALMIWLFTLRAGARLELRQLGRDMWRELSRGFPHVFEAVSGFTMLSGDAIDISGANEFPKGLTPEPV